MNAVDDLPVPEYDVTPHIFAVGEFDWPQGYDYLLAALSRLKQDGVSFQAWLVGDGPLYAPFRYSIGALDLEPEVTLIRADAKARAASFSWFPEFFTHPEGYKRMSRNPRRYWEWIREMVGTEIYVLPAHMDTEENRAYLKQALSWRLSAIITDAANASGLVQAGGAGTIIPARDIPALTQALKKVMSDE